MTSQEMETSLLAVWITVRYARKRCILIFLGKRVQPVANVTRGSSVPRSWALLASALSAFAHVTQDRAAFSQGSS